MHEAFEHNTGHDLEKKEEKEKEKEITSFECVFGFMQMQKPNILKGFSWGFLIKKLECRHFR